MPKAQAQAQAHGGSTPKSWPADVGYLGAPEYSHKLTVAQLQAIRAPAVSVAGLMEPCATPCPSVRITPIVDSLHPANGQSGLFAARTLPPNTLILHYLGQVHAEDESDPESDYDLSLDREAGVGVDATRRGNEARFINDYRGISTAGPNAEFRECWVRRGDGQAEKRIGVFVLPAGKRQQRAKGIGKGQEILVSYGKGFWEARGA